MKIEKATAGCPWMMPLCLVPSTILRLKVYGQSWQMLQFIVIRAPSNLSQVREWSSSTVQLYWNEHKTILNWNIFLFRFFTEVVRKGSFSDPPLSPLLSSLLVNIGEWCFKLNFINLSYFYDMLTFLRLYYFQILIVKIFLLLSQIEW